MAKEDGPDQVTGKVRAFLPLPIRRPEVAAALLAKGSVRSNSWEWVAISSCRGSS